MALRVLVTLTGSKFAFNTNTGANIFASKTSRIIARVPDFDQKWLLAEFNFNELETHF